MVRARTREATPAAPRGSLRTELSGGFREVRTRAWVWVTLLGGLVLVFASVAPFFALGAVVARDQYGSSVVFGWLDVAAGVGTIVGAVVGIRWRPIRPVASAWVMLGLWSVVIAMFALGLPLAIVLPGMGLAGFAVTLFMVWWETALAERIPPAALSRVSSYDWMVSSSLLPVGYLLSGVLAERLDAATVLAVGCAIGFVAAPLALASGQLRAVRRIGAGSGASGG